MTRLVICLYSTYKAWENIISQALLYLSIVFEESVSSRLRMPFHVVLGCTSLCLVTADPRVHIGRYACSYRPIHVLITADAR